MSAKLCFVSAEKMRALFPGALLRKQSFQDKCVTKLELSHEDVSRTKRALAPVPEAGGDEAFEERVGGGGLGLELGVKLAGEEERVVFQLDEFDELAVG